MEVKELSKPMGKWCSHCDIGVGCKVYSTRPGNCADFHCGYLTMQSLSEEWWPQRSKLVLAAEPAPERIAVYVDPGRPHAWREEPYYSKIKELAALMTPCEQQVVVYLGQRVIVVLPDSDVDLGVVKEGEIIATRGRETPFGIEWEAFKADSISDARILSITKSRPA